MSKNNSILEALGHQDGRRRILVAPLDWGLGHATRCIPVVYTLQEAGHEVWLAGEGAQEKLLRSVFPHLNFLPLPGYRVKYGKSAPGTTLKIASQLPRLRKQIKDENRWLKEMQQQYQFDIIISDNRFGLYHSDVRSVFITHQLWIIHPWGKWASRWMQKWNYSQIKNFSECWVPDHAGPPGLAGILSHPEKQPNVPVKYIGPLSRLQPQETAEEPGSIFISISGPEPQRTLMENETLRVALSLPNKITIVLGRPDSDIKEMPAPNIHVYGHLDTLAYQNEMAKAEIVISRSGYSTVMDIMAMKKKSILIPTPGQTEQEYLAEHLEKIGLARKAGTVKEALAMI